MLHKSHGRCIHHLRSLSRRSISTSSAKSAAISSSSAVSSFEHDQSRVDTHTNDNLLSSKPFESVPSVNKHKGTMAMMRDLSNKRLMSDLFLRWSQEMDNTSILRFKVPFAPEMVVLLDPRDYETVLRQTMVQGNVPFRSVVDPWLMYRHTRNLPIGLTHERDKKWLEVRSAANQIMLPKLVESAIGRLNECAVDVLDVIDASLDGEGHLRNIREIGFFFGLEAIVSVLLGKRMGLLEASAWGPESTKPAIADDTAEKMVRGVTTMFATTQQLMDGLPFYRLLGTLSPTLRKHYEAWDDMIASGRAIRDSVLGKETGDTLMDFVRTKGNLDGDDFDIMSVELMAGGVDTTGTTLAWLLYHLAANPEKQENLYKEIVAVVGPDPSTPCTKQHLTRSKYLKHCLRESMRLTPTVGMHVRTPDVDLTISGYHVPANSVIMMSNATSAKDPKEYGPDVEQFIPERYESFTAHPFSSLPFGFGSRQCVGQRVAETEVKILAAKIVQKYRLEYTPGPNNLPKMKENTLIVPDISAKDGEWIKFVKRN